jgi:hypothetical protein
MRASTAGPASSLFSEILFLTHMFGGLKITKPRLKLKILQCFEPRGHSYNMFWKFGGLEVLLEDSFFCHAITRVNFLGSFFYLMSLWKLKPSVDTVKVKGKVSLNWFL